MRRKAEKARRLTFFRNGDYFDSGVRVALRGARPFPTLPHLLDYLSLKTRMPARRVFEAGTGRPISSLEQFEGGGAYVVTSDGKFEPLPYGSVPRMQTSHVADALPVKREDLQLLRPLEGPLFGKKKKRHPPTGRREGRLLTVADREGGARATLLFNDKNPPPFEDILRDFGHALGLAQVKQMATPSGRQVRSLSQLRNEFRDVDTFFLVETDTNQDISSKSRRVETVSPTLELEWIHGYAGGPLLVLANSELVYAVGSALLLYKEERQRRYMEHTDDVCSLSAHPSGKMVASGQVSSEYQEACVRIWLIDPLHTVAVVDGLLGNPVSLSFSTHDFVLLIVEVAAEERSLSFWDWETDALLRRVQLREDHVIGGEFHPEDPDLAATFGRHHLAFWRRKRGGAWSRTDAHGHSGSSIRSWCFVGQSLAVGDSSGCITLWALLPASRIVREVRAHQGEVSCLACTSEGSLLSGGQQQLKAWDAHLRHLDTRDLEDGEVLRVASGPALFVGTTEALLEGSSLHTLTPGIAGGLLDLCVDSSVPSFVTVDRGSSICRWTARHLMWKTTPPVSCQCVGFHPGRRAVVSGGADGRLLVLRADGGEQAAAVWVADDALRALAFNSGRVAHPASGLVRRRRIFAVVLQESGFLRSGTLARGREGEFQSFEEHPVAPAHLHSLAQRSGHLEGRRGRLLPELRSKRLEIGHGSAGRAHQDIRLSLQRRGTGSPRGSEAGPPTRGHCSFPE